VSSYCARRGLRRSQFHLCKHGRLEPASMPTWCRCRGGGRNFLFLPALPSPTPQEGSSRRATGTPPFTSTGAMTVYTPRHNVVHPLAHECVHSLSPTACSARAPPLNQNQSPTTWPESSHTPTLVSAHFQAPIYMMQVGLLVVVSLDLPHLSAPKGCIYHGVPLS